VKPQIRLYFMGKTSKAVEDGELLGPKAFEAQIGTQVDYIVTEIA
jgi:hypothetical protein